MLAFLGIKAEGIQSNLVASDQMWSPYGFRCLPFLPNFMHTIKKLKIKSLPKRASNSISYLVETALVETSLSQWWLDVDEREKSTPCLSSTQWYSNIFWVGKPKKRNDLMSKEYPEYVGHFLLEFFIRR